MIKKSGNKSNRTVLMENALYQYFLNSYSVELESEIQLSNGGRADLYANVKDSKGVVQDTIIVEIKQSVSDFYSGCGLNFIAKSNYLAVPSELVGSAIVFLRDVLRSPFTGVIEVTDKGLVRTVMYPRNRYSNFTPYHLLQG